MYSYVIAGTKLIYSFENLETISLIKRSKIFRSENNQPDTHLIPKVDKVSFARHTDLLFQSIEFCFNTERYTI